MRWLGDAGVGVSTAVVTVFVLIFGEISPKSLAKEVPERFAMAVYPLIRVFVTVLKPVNWLFTKWKQFLSRLLRMDDDHAITQDELLTLVEEAKQEGGMNCRRERAAQKRHRVSRPGRQRHPHPARSGGRRAAGEHPSGNGGPF